MVFKERLKASRPAAITVLMSRAALLNKLAKLTLCDVDRRRLYERKSRTLSWLIVLGGGWVEEVLFERGLATVRLLNGLRQHIPLEHLSDDARQVVEAALLRRLRRAA